MYALCDSNCMTTLKLQQLAHIKGMGSQLDFMAEKKHKRLSPEIVPKIIIPTSVEATRVGN